MEIFILSLAAVQLAQGMSIIFVDEVPPPFSSNLASQALQVSDFAFARRTSIQLLMTEFQNNVPNDDVRNPLGEQIDRTAIAARKLGHMRAVEATSLLVKHITFTGQTPTRIGRGITLANYAPCVVALGMIGPSAFSPLIDAIVKTDDERILKYSAWVFALSLGKEFAGVYLSHRAETETDAVAKRRIVKSRSLIDTLPRP